MAISIRSVFLTRADPLLTISGMRFVASSIAYSLVLGPGTTCSTSEVRLHVLIDVLDI